MNAVATCLLVLRSILLNKLRKIACFLFFEPPIAGPMLAAASIVLAPGMAILGTVAALDRPVAPIGRNSHDPPND
jgi:hypothetical protein